MSFLNFIVELAITKSEGSAFQIGIIRVEKKYFLTSFLAIGNTSHDHHQPTNWHEQF